MPRFGLVLSIRQQQEKLSQSFSFLDQQAPNFQQRVNRLQAELADSGESFPIPVFKIVSIVSSLNGIQCTGLSAYFRINRLFCSWILNSFHDDD
jgi:hypothetical protein